MLTQGVRAERHALVPVAGQSQAMLVDDDPRPISGNLANQSDGLVVRTIIGDKKVERTAFLVQNGVERLGEMGRAVAGGDGDRKQGDLAGHGFFALGSAQDAVARAWHSQA